MRSVKRSVKGDAGVWGATLPESTRMPDTPKLTALAHGGGCGCKLPPSTLQAILAGMPAMAAFPNLLVGTETADDAAVYRLNDRQALVATTDFFTPVVDDPFDFGRIAATNALSDVYAMGGTPIMALAILGMPQGKVPPAVVQRVVAGGAQVCAAAGIPVAGGPFHRQCGADLRLGGTRPGRAGSDHAQQRRPGR